MKSRARSLLTKRRMTTTDTKERPILFSAPMVRALLAGTKTQTRRVVKPQPIQRTDVDDPTGVTRNGWWWLRPNGTGIHSQSSPEACMALVANHPRWWCPYGEPGERLWVRETFCHKFDDNGCFVYNAERNLDPTCCWYAADGVEVTAQDGDGFTLYRKDGREASPWTPSIHMPRWACRIVLELTDVRVERLQAISEDDARAEGVRGWDEPSPAGTPDAYRLLWESINGPGSWDANPYVWALTFRRVTA